jgi:hypothetical protein
MTKLRVTLSVNDSHLKQLRKVAQAAKKAGMKLEQQLDTLGVLTGVIDADKVEHLRRIEGVSSVEQEREVRVPTPGSPLQ